MLQSADAVVSAQNSDHAAGMADDSTQQFVSRQVLSAFAAAEQFRRNELAGKHDRSSNYPENALAQRLELISRLLKNDSCARVFYTVQGGYDTHASQLQTQANLLGELSSALKAFLDDLKEARLDDRVLVLAFSEFGRRVAENDSLGTDHGTAGPVFLAGPCVNAGLHGKSTNLSDLEGGDLKSTTDFREIYATVLDQWLKLRAPNTFLYFQNLALIRSV
jgi:uncharacterized protein (DUF1501 family)